MVITARPPEEHKEIRTTLTFNKVLAAWDNDGLEPPRYRNVWSEGGTWSSKTFSKMQMLILLLSSWQGAPLLCTVSSESMPHLKKGCIRDFTTIMGGDLNEKAWNKTDFIYTWDNGCQMEFVSADRQSKFMGGRRDILFCNEVNNIPQFAFRQASMRTRMWVICDWNPVGEFWFHDEELIKIVDEFGVETGETKLRDPENNCYIHSTYMDALEVLPESVRKEIESYKEKDPNWWRVYGLGLVGKLQGLVYPNFQQIEKLPTGLDRCYGLDYGFSSDPTALVECIFQGENLYSRELLYKPGLTNDDIAREMDYLKVSKYDPIYADANEPKSAEELCRLGYNVIPVEKAYFRVSYRIQKVNQYYQYWTQDSLNGIKEQRNHRYLEDREHPGRYTEKTTHQWSHLMSAREFAAVSYEIETGNEHQGRRY